MIPLKKTGDAPSPLSSKIGFLPEVCLIYGLTIAFLGASFIGAQAIGLPFASLARDTTAVLNGHPFVGMISNLGVLLFAMATGISLFCYAFLAIATSPRQAQFFLATGLFTGMLMIDDLFLLHENIFPLMLNISESLVFLFYIVCFCLYCFTFRKHLLNRYSYFFLLAAVFFAVAMTADKIPFLRLVLAQEAGDLLEDGAKMLGIVSWAAFVFRTGLQAVGVAKEQRQPLG